MLLEELPAKTFHALLRSITWTEVEVAFPIRNPLRRFLRRLARPSRWFVDVRQNDHSIGGATTHLKSGRSRFRG